jgi:hypothetical protein
MTKEKPSLQVMKQHLQKLKDKPDQVPARSLANNLLLTQ